MTNILSQSISRYVDHLLDLGDEIVHAEAAEQFISDNTELIQQHFAEVVLRQIVAEIKNRAQAPTKAFGQGVLFAGLPAAVTVADGRTKPLKACVWADLQIGRDFKVDNISNAIEALEAYDADLTLLRPSMEMSGISVAEAIAQVAA